MELPRDLDAALARLLESRRSGGSTLSSDDEAYLSSLLEGLRAGRRAVVVVEGDDERLRYLFSNATRAEAVSILGKVIESTGRRMAEEQE